MMNGKTIIQRENKDQKTRHIILKLITQNDIIST